MKARDRFFFPGTKKKNATCQGGAQPKASNTLTEEHTILCSGKEKTQIAQETNNTQIILSEYIPVCWYHPKGIYRARKKIEPRLPDVSRKLFLTFTVDPKLYANPASAFEHSRNRLRRVFYKLRKGLFWERKFIQLNSPYFIKVEFHKNEYAHFHVIFLTHRHLPANLLNHLWDLGRTNIKRISNKDFYYLLKYVSKGGELPEWVKEKKRIRIVQPSHGFYEALEKEKAKAQVDFKKTRKRKSFTIRERLERWSRMVVLQKEKRFRQLELPEPFKKTFDHRIFAIARDGNYLGNHKVKILTRKELVRWTISPKMMETSTLNWEMGSSLEELPFPIRLECLRERMAQADSSLQQSSLQLNPDSSNGPDFMT